jgi:hypothetical protein
MAEQSMEDDMQLRCVMIALLLASMVIAESARADELSVGLGAEIGLSLGDLAGKQMVRDTSFRPGLAIGAYMFFDFFEVAAFQMDLMWVQKGTVYDVFKDFDGLPDDGVTTLKYNYIELPILFNLGLPLDEGWRVFATAGMSIAVLTGAYMDIDYKSAPDHEDDIYDITGGFDMGWILGGGVGMENLSLDVRYEWGTFSTEDALGSGYVVSADRKNRCLMFLLSLRVPD